MSITGEGEGRCRMIFVPVGILQGPKKIICQGRGGRGVGGIGILHSYGATEPPKGSCKFYCQPTFLRTGKGWMIFVPVGI